MSEACKIDRVITSDLLVVGHGIAGLAVAIAAKEQNPSLNVLTVDKAFVGYAGKANKGGGHVAFIPEGGEEKYVEYHTRNIGDYLNDQDMLRIYAHSTAKAVDRWESWGVKFTVDKEHAENAHPIIPWKMCLVDLDMMEHMARHAKKLSVNSMNKISVTDLVGDGERVTGAFGFDLVSGESLLFRAKAVVLANGGQNFKVMRMWNSGRGDGIAAAFRAGAKLRNAEFGSFVNIIQRASKQVSYGAENHSVNARGEGIGDRADLDPALKNVAGGVDIGGAQSVLMYLEVRDGRGPVYEDSKANDLYGSFVGRNLCCLGQADPPFYRPLAQKFWDRLWDKNKAGSWKDDNPLKEIIPGLIGEFTPLYVGHNMETSLEGLYGAGDICGTGSGWCGAVPSPPGRNRGSGLMYAVVTGIRAGEAAGAYAAGHELGEADPARVEAARQRIFGYAGKEGLDPEELVWKIQNLMQPVSYSGYKSAERLQRALEQVLAVKARLPELGASDPHGLAAVNECQSIVLAAEMFFRASLERRESRGWHLREDCKERDDKGQLHWIVFTNDGGEMRMSFEDVPIGKYKYRPE